MRNKSAVVWGVLLVLLGAWFLVVQVAPGIKLWVDTNLSWPYQIVAVGAFLMLVGLLTWTPGLAIPACIVGGIGGIFVYQTMQGDYGSWAYVWTLIPGFAGVGTILAGLMEGKFKKMVLPGLWQVLGSLILFGIFGSFLGGGELLGMYWPIGVILAGVLVILTAFFKNK